MRHRLNKRDRIARAGKGCNKAQYATGSPKKKWLGRKDDKTLKRIGAKKGDSK